jgi:hypothetical protein
LPCVHAYHLFYGFGMPGYAALFWWGEDVIIPVGTRTWSNISLWQSPFLSQASSVDSKLSFGKHQHISSPRHLLSNCDPPPYENWIIWMSISNWLQWQLHPSRCPVHYTSLKTSCSQPLPHKASNTCHPISHKNTGSLRCPSVNYYGEICKFKETFSLYTPETFQQSVQYSDFTLSGFGFHTVCFLVKSFVINYLQLPVICR